MCFTTQQFRRLQGMDPFGTHKESLGFLRHTPACALALFSFRQHLFIKRSCIDFVPNDLVPLLRYSCRIEAPIRLFSVSVLIVFVGFVFSLLFWVGTFARTHVFRWISFHRSSKHNPSTATHAFLCFFLFLFYTIVSIFLMIYL